MQLAPGDTTKREREIIIMTIAVLGVSGRTGRVAAETLLEQGREVRVIVRDAAKGEPWAQRGAQVAVADVGDAEAVARALQGVEAAYLLVPPNFGVEDYAAYQLEVGKALVQAVKRAGLPRVVLLSSVAAQHEAGTGPIAALHFVEEQLRRTNTAATFLRAAYFMENLGLAFGALKDGILPSFFPADAPLEMVATSDIGACAARLLVEDGAAVGAPRIVQLAGPNELSMNDVASRISARLGRPIRVQVAPTSELVPTYTSFGLKPKLADMYREMTEGIISGHVAFDASLPIERGSRSLDSVLGEMLA
jgi:uncharacterized protein YbjT (DUF2867 family)